MQHEHLSCQFNQKKRSERFLPYRSSICSSSFRSNVAGVRIPRSCLLFKPLRFFLLSLEPCSRQSVLTLAVSTHYFLFQQVQVRTRLYFTCNTSRLCIPLLYTGIRFSFQGLLFLFSLMCILRVCVCSTKPNTWCTEIESPNPYVTKPDRFSMLCSSSIERESYWL
jgi:hypothetical protein